MDGASRWPRHQPTAGQPNPTKIATEGALFGSIRQHGLLQNTVVVSDDAGQFRTGSHALCWIHAERLVHELIPFNDRQRLRSSWCAS